MDRQRAVARPPVSHRDIDYGSAPDRLAFLKSNHVFPSLRMNAHVDSFYSNGS